MKKLSKIINKTSGKLTYLGIQKSEGGRTFVKVLCQCGTVKFINKYSYTKGLSKTCGCSWSTNESVTTHGDTKKDSEYFYLYRRYNDIKTRCYNKNREKYKIYGGRGIEMCEEWKNSYESFKDWALQNGWDKNLSIDRINNNGNYEPSNCRWVDNYVQANNKSNNVIIEIDGVKKNLTQWARYYGVNVKTAHTRYSRNKDIKDIFNLDGE